MKNVAEANSVGSSESLLVLPSSVKDPRWPHLMAFSLWAHASPLKYHFGVGNHLVCCAVFRFASRDESKGISPRTSTGIHLKTSLGSHLKKEIQADVQLVGLEPSSPHLPGLTPKVGFLGKYIPVANIQIYINSQELGLSK